MSEFKAKGTEIDFGWGSAPDSAGKAYNTLPDPLAGIKGTYFQGKRKGAGREGEKRHMKTREGRERRGWEGSGGGTPVCRRRLAYGRKK